MFGEHHDLVHELPEYRDKIHEMKMNDAHFAKLFDEYHEVDHEVRRIEQEIETPSDEYTEELKKKRLNLKDQLFVMLKQG
ncbi:MAG: YdcH family protein [Pseudomonadota bacterium]